MYRAYRRIDDMRRTVERDCVGVKHRIVGRSLPASSIRKELTECYFERAIFRFSSDELSGSLAAYLTCPPHVGQTYTRVGPPFISASDRDPLREQHSNMTRIS
jgi:hypothetical protein